MQKFFFLFLSLQGAAGLTFCIGGPYGHGQRLRERANLCIKLSSLVFNHQIALLVLVEQLYRYKLAPPIQNCDCQVLKQYYVQCEKNNNNKCYLWKRAPSKGDLGIQLPPIATTVSSLLSWLKKNHIAYFFGPQSTVITFYKLQPRINWYSFSLINLRNM